MYKIEYYFKELTSMTEKGLKDLLYDLKIDRYEEYYEVKERMKKKGIDPETFSVTDGASKICIIFDDLPFVVKWSYGEEGYDEAMQEVWIYKEAKKAGLEFFFPKTDLFCEVNGISFVKQQKVDYSVSSAWQEPIERKMEKIGHNASEKIVKKMERAFNKTHGYSRGLSRLWAKAALVVYGKRKCKALCDFVIEHDINDLHNNNLGFSGLNPIILDFSGYHRGCSS